MPCYAVQHLLQFRNDAGLAGAELALAVEQHTHATGAWDTVGTTGIFKVSPNAVNSVPREARLGIGESLWCVVFVCEWCACVWQMRPAGGIVWCLIVLLRVLLTSINTMGSVLQLP